jgi:hypothetical protein
MLSWLVAAGVLLFLLYATGLLFFNLDSERETNLEDFLRSSASADKDGKTGIGYQVMLQLVIT